MGLLQRSSFARGWVPDADAVNGPADGLLRMDNGVLDERGVVALRKGSAAIGSALADLDVHSLFTAVLSGTRVRMAGAGNNVYANGVAKQAMAGGGDVAFGSHLGQILFARSTTKKKYDGTTVRNWGVTPSASGPVVTPVASDGKTLATCDQADGEFTVIEDDGSGPTYNTGQDGSANGSVNLVPDPDTHRGALQKLFGGSTDFTAYNAGGVGTPNDLVELYFYIDDPAALLGVTLMVDVNASSTAPFQDDYYWHTWSQATANPLAPAAQADIPTTLASSGTPGARVRGLLPAEGIAVARGSGSTSTVRPDKPVANSGWSKLQVRREDMARVGSTSGKDWKTVKAIRLVVETIKPASTRFDTIRIAGNPLNGRYRWCAVSVYNSGQYVGKSAPSPLSTETQIQGQGASVAVAASADGQVNETWLFRMGGVMDAFYRTAVASANGGAILDSLSDIDAMTLNIKLETDNAVAPDNVIAIAGPYAQRTFALTSDGYVWPSRRINPDSFATGQGIRVTGPDETPLWMRLSLGGLYVGTTKDIYRVAGTGAELPDGTTDFNLENLNIDHPPISAAVAQDGNVLIYLAADGWRSVAGAGSSSIVGDTSLLYRGYTRHGVGPVDIAAGRFRAAIAHNQLVAITPETVSPLHSPVLYRHAPLVQTWYRHVYPQAFRSITREPDGTLLAGDVAGLIWQLDTGTNDGGTAIPVTIWTTVDDNGAPFQRKDPEDLRVGLHADAATVALHLDGSSTPAITLALSGGDIGGSLTSSLATIATQAFRHAQLRITVSPAQGFLEFYNFGLAYRDHPIFSVFTELKPSSPSIARRRFGGLHLLIDTLGGAATVTPILDGTALASQTVTANGPLSRHVGVSSAVGRDLWATIALSTGFELAQWEPLVLETLPAQLQGVTPRALFGSSGVKAVSGIQIRVCTLAATRTVTMLVDGVSAGTFTVLSGADDPVDQTFALIEVAEGVEFSLSFDGAVELYNWSPIVTARRPLGVLTYDTGPIDLGTRELVWLRHAYVKARASAPLTIAVYMDGAAVATGTSDAVSGGDTIVPIDFGRGVKGRQPRLVISSAGVFNPYWAKFVRRLSGRGTDKAEITVPLTVEGTGA